MNLQPASPRIHKSPIVRIGLVSDIQYADIDNRFSFGGKERHYRHSLQLLDEATTYWNQEGVEFVVHCGDVIDGQNCSNGTVNEAIESVTNCLSKVKSPVHHILGNHCVYTMDRERLHKELNMPTPTPDVGYYSIAQSPGWKFLMLDSSDVALFGRPHDHKHTLEARHILGTCNPNPDKMNTDGMEGARKRFVGFGGGIGEAQLEWIRLELNESRQKGQNVVVFSHLPLIEGLYRPVCLLWNYEEVLKLLHEFPIVKLAMYGHTHKKAYLQDQNGIHHMVLPGLVECGPGGKGVGCLRVFDDRLEVHGFDSAEPLVMNYESPQE